MRALEATAVGAVKVGYSDYDILQRLRTCYNLPHNSHLPAHSFAGVIKRLMEPHGRDRGDANYALLAKIAMKTSVAVFERLGSLMAGNWDYVVRLDCVPDSISNPGNQHPFCLA
jgi:hypothetical protein